MSPVPRTFYRGGVFWDAAEEAEISTIEMGIDPEMVRTGDELHTLAGSHYRVTRILWVQLGQTDEEARLELRPFRKNVIIERVGVSDSNPKESGQ